jgi:hypothetical protein
MIEIVLPVPDASARSRVSVENDRLARINLHVAPRHKKYSEMSRTATPQRKPFQSAQHHPSALNDMSSTLIFGFSWLLVMAIGLMPLAEGALARSPSIAMPTTIAFFVSVGSAILLRRRCSWMGLVLHIFGQIGISLRSS